MFMGEYDKLEDVARRELNYLHDHGLFDASAVLDELLTQRNQLLEALKLLHSNFKSQHKALLMLGAPDFTYMDAVASEAIRRAEAS